MEEQSNVRANAQQRKREARGQRDLFSSDVMATPYLDGLRSRYRQRAVEAIAKKTPCGKHVPYKDIAVAAMQVPTIADQDVKDILKEQRKAGCLQFWERPEGPTAFTEMSPRRVVQWNENHFVLRTREAQ
jgi:hypothetical protein